MSTHFLQPYNTHESRIIQVLFTAALFLLSAYMVFIALTAFEGSEQKHVSDKRIEARQGVASLESTYFSLTEEVDPTLVQSFGLQEPDSVMFVTRASVARSLAAAN